MPPPLSPPLLLLVLGVLVTAMGEFPICAVCAFMCVIFLSIIKRRVPQHLKMEQEKLQVCLLPDISHENNFLWQCDGFFNS